MHVSTLRVLVATHQSDIHTVLHGAACTRTYHDRLLAHALFSPSERQGRLQSEHELIDGCIFSRTYCVATATAPGRAVAATFHKERDPCAKANGVGRH